jgi:hypothetical protein
MTRLQYLPIVVFSPLGSVAWITPPIQPCRNFCESGLVVSASLESNDFVSLVDMDIVLFSRNGGKKQELGAIQGDGTLAPLSAWTLEPAYDNTIEFVVDEELRFPGLTATQVEIIKILDERVIGYGSRQVGGGKGPKNPHGEESELLYYVDLNALKNVDLVVNPGLEINW